MPKIRRGNYIFISQLADHAPRHVHVYREGRLVAKWDLERGEVMKGKVGSRLRKIIETLEHEGTL